MTISDQVKLIRRGATEVISQTDITNKLKARQTLIVKAGFDPTAPDLHLGHTVLLRKLRHFQDLGHKVIFLIGDATALVGDPSGQSKKRKSMMWEEVDRNAHTYEVQVSKILDVKNPERYELRFNSHWFGRGGRIGEPQQHFGIDQLIELTSRYTVARLIERDDFEKRLKAGQEISVLELLYPLMQGYDSVQIKADVELGGTDQKFNLLVGRDLQRSYGQEPQVVITMPLLEGTDGVQKMSKSLGNHIGINEPPNEMFGKIMSIPDTLIVKYFTLLTDVEPSRLAELEQKLQVKSMNPRDAKLELAFVLVAMYHNSDAAFGAKKEFLKVFSRREKPSEIPLLSIRGDLEGKVSLIEILVRSGLVQSNNEARRLLRQGAVKLNGAPVLTPSLSIEQVAESVLQIGSRHFRKLVIEKVKGEG